MSGITLKDEDFRSLGVCATHCTDKEKFYNSLAFSADGSTLYATSTANHILMFDIDKKRMVMEIPNKEYGCVHVAASSHPKAILYASNQDVAASENQGLVLLHSVHDNRILREFCYHDKQVTSIAVRPGSDQFATSADDDPALVAWDIRTSKPISITPFSTREGSARCAYDPLGKVLVSLRASGGIAVFDASMLATPFLTTQYNPKDTSMGVTWTHAELSPDNRFFLAVTEEEGPVLFDGYRFTLVTRLNRHPVNGGAAAFSPDGRYVVVGGDDGRVYTYNVGGLDPAAGEVPAPAPICCGSSGSRVSGGGGGGGGSGMEGTGPAHAAGVEAVAFSPTSLLLASASVELSLWQ